MNKELFCRTIRHIEYLYEKGETFSKTISLLDTESCICFNPYNEDIIFLQELLEELTKDTCEEISYFLWELDFGHKYYDGCITDAGGNYIKMATPEDLWEAIENDHASLR